MAGLVPAIHVLFGRTEDGDARHKAGHDGLQLLPDSIRHQMLHRHPIAGAMCLRTASMTWAL
jgi:hypothetical protein